MSETVECQRCGRTRPAGGTAILGDGCPYCLLMFALGDDDGLVVGKTADDDGPSTSAELPERIGPYRLLELLGAGGMGSVYRARHESLGRIVALKLLHPEFAARAGFAERFQREGRVLAGLEHRHILDVHDVGCDGGFYYLATEYVAGATLRERIEAGPLPVDESIQLFGEMCEALQIAHERGVIHRDIKPENILLDADGRVKIADFGIAKLIEPDSNDRAPPTEVDVVVGTRRYMAPEQLEPGRPIDQRADLYALGVVLYEMLTGELPLGVFAPPSRKAEIDARIDGPVLAALAKNPADRPANARELRRRVEAAIQPNSRSRRWILGATVALLGGAAFAVWRSRSIEAPDRSADELLERLGAMRLVHPAPVWGVAFSPTTGRPATACEDRRLRIWDPESGQTASSWIAYPRGELGYLSLAFSPDGRTLATAGGENVARLWDVASQRERAVLQQHSREIVAVAYSHDGRTIATAGHDRAVRLWNAADGTFQAKLRDLPDPALSVVFSFDDQMIAAGLMNGAIEVWNAERRELTANVGHTKRVWALTSSPHGPTFISGSHDRTIKTWTFTPKPVSREIPTDGEVWSVAVSPAGDLLAIGRDDGMLLLWSWPDGKRIAEVKAHAGSVVSVAFSADGKRLATGSLDQSAVVWEVARLRTADSF